MKKITIITLSYNHSKYISQAIESVLNQSFQDFEYLIWDDGSSDNSREVIASYASKDSRINFFTHKDTLNKGIAKTMQACVREVKTPYVAFLESDDYWDKDFLKNMLLCAEKNKNISLFYCDITIIGDKSNYKDIVRHQKLVEQRKNFIKKQKLDRSLFLFQIPISTFSSIFLNADLLLNASFDTPSLRALDRYFYSQCYKYGTMFLNQKLSFWRKHTESFTGKIKQKVNSKIINMFDVPFYNLYPNGSQKDLDFINKILSGKKEKIFRPFLRLFVCQYLRYKYGKQLFTFKIFNP